eukprot:352888-Chlamydomonas_euryale.AAC.2
MPVLACAGSVCVCWQAVRLLPTTDQCLASQIITPVLPSIHPPHPLTRTRSMRASAHHASNARPRRRPPSLPLAGRQPSDIALPDGSSVLTHPHHRMLLPPTHPCSTPRHATSRCPTAAASSHSPTHAPPTRFSSHHPCRAPSPAAPSCPTAAASSHILTPHVSPPPTPLQGAKPDGIALSDGSSVAAGGVCAPLALGTSGGMVFFYCVLSIVLFCGGVVGSKIGLERYQVGARAFRSCGVCVTWPQSRCVCVRCTSTPPHRESRCVYNVAAVSGDAAATTLRFPWGTLLVQLHKHAATQACVCKAPDSRY